MPKQIESSWFSESEVLTPYNNRQDPGEVKFTVRRVFQYRAAVQSYGLTHGEKMVMGFAYDRRVNRFTRKMKHEGTGAYYATLGEKSTFKMKYSSSSDEDNSSHSSHSESDKEEGSDSDSDKVETDTYL